MEQVCPDQIDWDKVTRTVAILIMKIDEDLEENAEVIREIYHALTNDEKMALTDRLKYKAPGCNKMYSSLLKEYLKL